MKKLFALLLTFSMVLSLTACGGNEDSDGGVSIDSGERVVKVGVHEPISGPDSEEGRREILGIEYAHSVAPAVEIGGEEYQVELEIVGNQSEDDSGGISAAQRLIEQGVSIVLGSYGSSGSMAAIPVLEKAGIPVIGCSRSRDDVTEGNPYCFRICYLDSFQGGALANLAVDEFQADVAYVLTESDDDYSVSLGESFTQEFERLGGKVVAGQNPAGSADMSAFVAEAQEADADVMFAPCSAAAAALLIEQAASAGIPLIAGDTWDDPAILQAAAQSGADVYFSAFYDEGASQLAADFVTGFKDWINASSDKLTYNGGTDAVSAVSALGYDAYMAALEAIKDSGSTDGAAICRALADVTYTGVTGGMVFNKGGDVDRSLIYIKGVDTASGTFYSVKELGLAR